MKQKNLSKKLTLNRKTVANLESSELKSIQGGTGPNMTYPNHCPSDGIVLCYSDRTYCYCPPPAPTTRP